MLFTEPTFWMFFPLVLIALAICRYLRNLTLENLVLLTASYVFYAYWDPRFLILIIGVSAQTYLAASTFARLPPALRRLALWVSISLNLGVLVYFKYYNFFADSLIQVFPALQDDVTFLQVILPVGISFYIFQTLTYVLDVYKDRMQPAPSVLNYFTYVAFFPQLVAGPIERAAHLLPQFSHAKTLHRDDIVIGTRLIVMGLFMKMVFANTLAGSADDIFAHYADRNVSERVLGIIFFSGQIYGDFCGYSLTAIGLARVMGFRLMRNFETPYLSTSITEFWRRWHISLSSFFRDYIYIPMGGSRQGFGVMAAALMTAFLLSGLWHGAAVGFIIWGALHGLVVLTEHGLAARGARLPAALPGQARAMIGWVYTLGIVGIAWVFFRLPEGLEALHFLDMSTAALAKPSTTYLSDTVLVVFVLLLDAVWRRTDAFEQGGRRTDALVAFCLFVVINLQIFGGGGDEFIYFQF